MVKNPAAIWLRFAMYVALSLMIGTVWLDVGDDASMITDIINVLFFIAAFMVFMSISVLPAFLEEKAIFLKERANGAYGVAAYNIAHAIVDTPFMFLLALVCGTLTFWCIGLDDDPNVWMAFVTNLFLSFMVAESLMLLIASVVPFLIVGIAVGAFCFGAFMIVQGFFLKVSEIGWWWRWMHYVGLHTYSFATFMHYQFHDRVYPCGNPSAGMWACPDGAVSGDDVLELYSFDGVDPAANFAVLAAMTAGYRVAAALWMWRFHTGKK
mmetsp:Transcript_23002/g.78328  ORF Transcript_23002/g.78328 Transcript_23002/m.78328 type:complete len:267 (+) Transcript_23002:2-802(+)